MDKKLRIVIWILVGSCVLNLIFALNAGQKRKIAISRSDTLDARLTELELRYKNAVQSYDAINKELGDTKKDLQEQKVFSDTLKDSLLSEQKKTKDLQVEFNKLKAAQNPAANVAVKNAAPRPQDKKTSPISGAGKSNIKW